MIHSIVQKCAQRSYKRGSGGPGPRSEVAEWIHQKGGARALRPLNAPERERALGLPVGSSSLLYHDQPPNCDGIFNWDALSASGNTFAVPVFTHLFADFASWAAHGGEWDCLQRYPSTLTREEAIQSLSGMGGLRR